MRQASRFFFGIVRGVLREKLNLSLGRCFTCWLEKEEKGGSELQVAGRGEGRGGRAKNRQSQERWLQEDVSKKVLSEPTYDQLWYVDIPY